MFSLPNHFSAFLSNIEPKEDRVKAAQEMPTTVREYLKQHEDVITVEPHSRLAGSYARSTAIGNIKDVDIIIAVHLDYKDEEPKVILEILRDALKDLPEAIEDTGAVEIRKQRRSVHIYLEKADIDIDIVPAVIPYGLEEPLEVPDREWGKWILSHPLGYGDYLSVLNQNNNSKVKRLIKMIKHWRDTHMTYKRPKSYWLECLIVQHIEKGWVNTEGKSYGEIFSDLLESIYDKFEKFLDEENNDKVPQIKDPMLGNNVAFNWKRNDFETFMRRVKESKGWARQALSDEVDRDEAVSLWRKIFSEEFPEEGESTATDIASTIRAGGGSVTATGQILIGSTGQGIIIPEHRFYGSRS